MRERMHFCKSVCEPIREHLGGRGSQLGSVATWTGI